MRVMKKQILPLPAMPKALFFACAMLTLTSCSSDEFTGDGSSANGNGQGAISFSSGVGAVTRSDKTGAAAASDLNGQFYVWGIKNENTDGINDAAAGNLVFKNYLVKWVDNSAYTTTSNTKGWEYVGYTLSSEEQTNVTENSGVGAQTIKYWDYNATDYTYYAFSALPSDITAGNVSVAKIKSVTAPSTVYDKGYTVTLNASADLDKLFFAERVKIAQTSGTDRTAVNTYGGNVTFRFHNAATKVRVAMYETNPGYSVTIKKFKVDNDGDNPAFGDMTDDVTDNFAANLQYAGTGTAGTLTVKYVDAGTTQNHPTMSFSGTKAKVLALGTNLAQNTVLGTSVSGATYDKSDKAYTSVFPNEANTQNLKLKLDYTLTAPVTGETIEITDATAEIPAQYLKWKPGYAYTYIFKITDDKLYPITFDAVEVVDEDGVAEYITTVSEPSITTFGVSGGKYVTGGSDYVAGSAVYAVVEQGSALQTLSASNMQLYTVTTSDASNFPITEAAVAEALIEGPTLNKAAADAAKIKAVSSPLTYQNTVPAEDGTTITLHATDNKAATFNTTTATTYAIVYQKTAATYSVDGGQTYADETAFNNAGTLYTSSACTEVATWVDNSTSYYKRTAVDTKGEYVVKIVTCP